MNRILLFFAAVSLVFFVSCRSRRDGPTNEYKNAKTHTSETILKDHQKAQKRAERAAKKQGKKTKKRMNKRNGDFFKK
ncbi:MAG: hypothetical protein MUC87_18310 [Bacteroidia bacterium]|jgi:hypothetical protein|nr:hypothetical protein [Bacteroidia bacterium]